MLHLLAGCARGLEDLDCGGCTHLTPDSIARLPAEGLRELRVSRGGWARTAALEAAARRWGHALEAVWAEGGEVEDEGAAALAHGSRLRYLSLEQSRVTAVALQPLLLGRGGAAPPPLETVNLAGCRGLSRPLRQAAAAGDVCALRKAVAAQLHIDLSES